jgi:hypothetical protein
MVKEVYEVGVLEFVLVYVNTGMSRRDEVRVDETAVTIQSCPLAHLPFTQSSHHPIKGTGITLRGRT